LKESAILVHQQTGRADGSESLQELRLLAESAGAAVVSCVSTSRKVADPATYIGKGKVAELSEQVKQLDADLVIINHSVSPIQERNLERAVESRVLDRTGLILDIFAQRAATHEGKLQVELAQLRHLSTRLVRGWTHLERQKGGIGLRGPGETQLETDRRLIGRRIKHLKKRLDKVSAQRSLRRKSRRKVPIPTVCLVGYTNAGKSSLFNRLTGADVMAVDQLFATLDPTMRRLDLPDRGSVILSDTVGFIRDLPHTLVQAFHSTLEEVAQAALLIHVVDASDEEHDVHMGQVDSVLEELGAGEIPTITVYNKIDLTGRVSTFECNEQGLPDRIWLSAHSGDGLDVLRDAVQQYVNRSNRACIFHIPAVAAEVRAFLYRHANVIEEDLDQNGAWVMRVEIADSEMGRMHGFDSFKACSEVSEALSADTDTVGSENSEWAV
jgi:GTP-binding protein HflX